MAVESVDMIILVSLIVFWRPFVDNSEYYYDLDDDSFDNDDSFENDENDDSPLLDCSDTLTGYDNYTTNYHNDHNNQNTKDKKIFYE